MNVLIVDDHPMIREYLRGAAARAFPDAVVRSVGTLREALEEAKERPPQLVLLDLGLPDAKGLESILRFREAQPQIPVVVVSGDDDGDSVRGALALGAAGFVPKSSGPQVLLSALRLVAEGGRYIPPEALGELEPGPPQAASAEGRLTKRQREVLARMLAGLGNAQIAKALDIEETTVRQHAHAVYSAFGVSTRAELMAAARQRKAGSG